MTAYPAWTPASRPGIIPLHPLSFGTILGRSFAALRQNPRVLLGFALVVQTAAYLVVIAAVGAIGIASFSRLDTVVTGSEEFQQIMAGSIALTAIAGFALGMAAGALGVIVQGIVVTEVAHAAVAEKRTLGALWRQVRPVAWRLIGYAFLLGLVAVAAISLIVAALVALGTAALPVAILLGLLLLLAAIPLTLWLSTKLLLAPAVIILERATIRDAVVRAWTLVRGRFWVALGVIVLISMVFGAVAQIVSLPFSLLSSGLGTIIAPTGAGDVTGIIAMVVLLLFVQAVTLVIQSIATVVQSTATAILYIDCRMRREALDLDLLAYVERRDAGTVDLPDPYTLGIGRASAPPRAAYAPGYGADLRHAAALDPRYAGQFGYVGQPPAAMPAAYAPPTYAPPAAPSPDEAEAASGTPAGTDPTQWTAPGATPPGEEQGWR